MLALNPHEDGVAMKRNQISAALVLLLSAASAAAGDGEVKTPPAWMISPPGGQIGNDSVERQAVVVQKSDCRKKGDRGGAMVARKTCKDDSAKTEIKEPAAPDRR